LLVGDRDGVQVVGADGDGRGLPHAGEVHPRVEVDLRGCAIAEVDAGDRVLAPQLRDVGVPDGMGELGGDGDGDDVLAVAVDVPSGVGEASPVRHERFDGQAAGDLDAVLAVGREDEVPLLEGEGGAYLHGFLALEHGV